MRKIIVSMMVSADGFFEGRNHDLNWHVWDERMGDYMTDFIGNIDTFLYGRKSYELMLQYWPKAQGAFADLMNNTKKLIFSRTLDQVEWNSELVKSDVREEMLRQKELPGKHMVLFAGADLLSDFIRMDLVDEYRLIVNPVAIGSGTPLFKDLSRQVVLKLTDTRIFACGNVILFYKPVSKIG